MYVRTQKQISDEVKNRLKSQGLTLKAFAEVNGFLYRDVSDVVRGVRRGYFGKGREIAKKLGMPVEE
ncbi:DNA-binding protein [Budviciaceae bacterium BWR-B9]|uniref:DNA-binding protein n=2 Tax=Limnobaculum TaxID=2172100 RepID=A0A411WIR6_9GAMM|nr:MULTISPECIES: DNA-binding protein [Limnobaculum]MBK5142992.1 DNA-binding protein [Limnobaculum allomyrinae]MBV7693321.1 DNA-binding protein [Limnobaculum sp. M2-1]QBH96067.1 DNA-binding protein [Limnobaculum zhutongyuii]TQS86150.1 DNA-binding protein [Limnobaculum zhutongyuii]